MVRSFRLIVALSFSVSTLPTLVLKEKGLVLKDAQDNLYARNLFEGDSWINTKGLTLNFCHF
jgi:hypothetical protein